MSSNCLSNIYIPICIIQILNIIVTIFIAIIKVVMKIVKAQTSVNRRIKTRTHVKRSNRRIKQHEIRRIIHVIVIINVNIVTIAEGSATIYKVIVVI